MINDSLERITTLKEIEEALEFGKTIGNICDILKNTAYVLDPKTTMLSDDSKRRIAENLDGQRQMVQRIVETVDQKYSGIKLAEKAKIYTQEKLAEIEKLVRLYQV